MPTKDDFPKDLAADAVLPFTLSGISLEIPRSILTPELWLAFEAGYYEGSEISALRSAVRPGDAVLEVGAGVGFISAFVQRALAAATVWVIEANEALIPTIHRTHELNGVSATVLTGVAGRCDGPVRFHHQAAFWGSSVLPLPDSQAADIPGIDLGRIIREMRPDVLVVDIEGGERDLFPGLDLSGVRSIVVEVHHPQIGPAGIARCFAALQDAGFAYYPDGSAGTNVVFTRFHPSPSSGSTSDASGEVRLGDHPGTVNATAYFDDARQRSELALDEANVVHANQLVDLTNAANAEIARLGLALEEAKTLHAKDHALIETLQGAIYSYTTSTSWRVTAPIRAAVDLIWKRGS